jgi:hypothetical protein
MTDLNRTISTLPALQPIKFGPGTHLFGDNEMNTKPWLEAMANLKIAYRCSTPDTPELNGFVERFWLTIFDAVRTMLYHFNLALDLWAMALLHAVYILNRLTGLDGKSPLERFTGQKPDLNFLLSLPAFGTTAFVKDQGTRTKLAPKGKKGIFIGVNPRNDGYMILMDETGRTVTSQSVQFMTESTPVNQAEQPAQALETLFPDTTIIDTEERLEEPTSSHQPPAHEDITLTAEDIQGGPMTIDQPPTPPGDIIMTAENPLGQGQEVQAPQGDITLTGDLPQGPTPAPAEDITSSTDYQPPRRSTRYCPTPTSLENKYGSFVAHADELDDDTTTSHWNATQHILHAATSVPAREAYNGMEKERWMSGLQRDLDTRFKTGAFEHAPWDQLPHGTSLLRPVVTFNYKEGSPDGIKVRVTGDDSANPNHHPAPAPNLEDTRIFLAMSAATGLDIGISYDQPAAFSP